jgi:hypothetical protein
MSTLNNKTSKVIELNSCMNVNFNKSLLGILEEEGGLVVIKVEPRVMQFKYVKFSKFKLAKRSHINSKMSTLQKKKAITQYKKPMYFIKNSRIASNKLAKVNLPMEYLFATRV